MDTVRVQDDFMGYGLLSKLIPAILGVAAGVLTVYWLGMELKLPDVRLREPGQDGVVIQAATGPVELRGGLVQGTGKPSEIPSNWSQFRGPGLDNISTENVPLARQFKPAGPPKVWSLELGEGYAGPAVHNGRVYLIDYDVETRSDVIRCLSLDDGKEIWRRSYAVDITRNHGISRTVPAVNDKYVVTMGPKCHVVCLDAVTGDYIWGIDLTYEYKTKVPLWYAGQCPYIDGDHVILAPGGSEALIMAVHLETGQVKWKTPNPQSWPMSHSCIVPMTFKGQRMYVYCTSLGTLGVSAEDGQVLWRYTDWKPATVVACPVQVDEDRILLTGYGTGCKMIRLAEAEDGKIVASTVFSRPPKVFGADQHTPILYQRHLYSLISGGQLVCMDLDGNQVWNSGSQRFGLGLGPFILADGMLVILDCGGTLNLVEASDREFKLIARATIFEHGNEAWGPLALVDGRLIGREIKRMACLDLRRASNE